MLTRFRFPIVIIDEDFRSENASGLGVRALAKAIEGEGVEVIGVTSFGDLSSFAQQQSRASAFIVSIDDEEFNVGGNDEVNPALHRLRQFRTAGSSSGPGVNSSSSIDKMNALARLCCWANWLRSP